MNEECFALALDALLRLECPSSFCEHTFVRLSWLGADTDTWETTRRRQRRCTQAALYTAWPLTSQTPGLYTLHWFCKNRICWAIFNKPGNIPIRHPLPLYHRTCNSSPRPHFDAQPLRHRYLLPTFFATYPEHLDWCEICFNSCCPQSSKPLREEAWRIGLSHLNIDLIVFPISALRQGRA